MVDHDSKLLPLAVKHRVQIQPNGPVPRLVVELVRQARLAHGAGIVDGNVQTPELRGDADDGVLDVRGAGDVEDEREDLDGRVLLRERGGESVEGVLVDVGDGEAGGAVAGKIEGCALADACIY